MTEKRREENFHRKTPKRMEVFISFSNVESSCFPRDTSFRMRQTCDAARENSIFLIFLRCEGELVHIYALISQDVGEFSMSWWLKFLSFPFRSVVSISWSEIVQLIRVCSLYIKAFVQSQQRFCLKEAKKNTFKKFSLKCLRL